MPRLPSPGGDDGNWGTILNEYLEVEHDADGSHKTEYLPLAGGTLSGNVDAADNTLSQAEIKDYAETVVVADTGDSYTVDLENGNVFKLTLTDSPTLTISNPPANGKAGSITLILIQDGSGNKTVTWPGSVLWGNGSEPTLSTGANAIDVVLLMTVDGGTTWLGFLAGQAFS